ncbi:hypothetical protein [Streptomyces fradiae]|uniref:hypothetical protein n=1 Tax=Streptomyces fradiae TaxID=1906 RepID=UPI00294223EF|nr:hypothetical protein [Streptomyces fradiae]WOI60850.1 hypothetical protein RYQ63_13610 [Streptomyces fradiae]
MAVQIRLYADSRDATGSLAANGDWSADGHWLFQYRGLSTGGVAAAEKTSATWRSLNGVF